MAGEISKLRNTSFLDLLSRGRRQPLAIASDFPPIVSHLEGHVIRDADFVNFVTSLVAFPYSFFAWTGKQCEHFIRDRQGKLEPAPWGTEPLWKLKQLLCNESASSMASETDGKILSIRFVVNAKTATAQNATVGLALSHYRYLQTSRLR